MGLWGVEVLEGVQVLEGVYRYSLRYFITKILGFLIFNVPDGQNVPISRDFPNILKVSE